jgi:hypothetical protein
MGVFSGLLNGLLGGSGLGDIAQKAMDIGGKIINRPEGQSLGTALIGQLPSIASGLGGVAKNFGGLIPGVGGLVSKIGGAVEGIANEHMDDEKKNLLPNGFTKEHMDGLAKEAADHRQSQREASKGIWKYKSWADIPSEYKSLDGLVRLFHKMSKEITNGNLAFIHGLDDIEPDLPGADMGLGTAIGYYDENQDGDEPFKTEIENWIRSQKSTSDVNSAPEMLRHASNNMQFIPGNSFGMHKDIVPHQVTQQEKRDRDFPTTSRGTPDGGWRKFAPRQGNSLSMVNPFGGAEADSMYASNLPHVNYKNSGTIQTVNDLGVAKIDKKKKKKFFRKNFVR